MVVDGRAGIYSGSAATSGFSAYGSAQTVGVDYLLRNGDANSQASVNGAQVNNIVVGNTLVDGDMRVNGALQVSSDRSVATTVKSGTSTLPGATATTTGALTIANAGGASVDTNGKLSAAGATQATASLTLTNGYGRTNGMVVTESQTTLSGGAYSSSLTMDDRGATYSNPANGNPIQVHGVADGGSDYDAVNMHQFRQLAAGVASTAAMANLVAPATNDRGTIGVGLGYNSGQTAIAVGFSTRLFEKGLYKASVATGTGGNTKPVIGMGLGWSW